VSYSGAGASACLAALALAACSQRTPEPQPRIAVLRFENLSADSSSDWMGRALSEILAVQMTGASRDYIIPTGSFRLLDRVVGSRPAGAPGVSAERDLALLAGASRIVYGHFSVVNGTLGVAATMEDLSTQQVVRSVSAARPVSDGVLAAADDAARRLCEQARPFATRNLKALKSYVAALEAPDRQAADQFLRQSLEADPNFGPAYLSLAQLALSRNDRAAATQILDTARTRGSAISELDLARIELEAATLRGDPHMRAGALARLAGLTPSDPTVWRNLAESDLYAGRYAKAIENYRKALEFQPNDGTLLNGLGYAHAYAGDLSAAKAALEKYQAIAQNPNPLDSLGDVHYYRNRFAEAARYYLESYQKDPGFLNGASLLKAAHARLMAGDLKEAQDLAERFLKARAEAQDPLLEQRRAEWEYLTGQRRQAVARMERHLLATTPEIAARARAQLAIWELLLGRSARPGAAPQPHEGIARLLAQDYAAAARELQKLQAQTSPAMQGGLPVLLAWALIETGRTREAVPYLETSPIPDASLAQITAFHFPRILYLRGIARNSAKDLNLFLQLCGPDPEIFGHEQRARAALKEM